jgi:hypothetical protein
MYYTGEYPVVHPIHTYVYTCVCIHMYVLDAQLGTHMYNTCIHGYPFMYNTYIHRYHCPLWMHYWVHKEAAASPHARISFFKNGKFQGYAFEDIWCGTYYPAASFYYGGCATANFGPEFRFPPKCPVSRSGVNVERGEGSGGGQRYVRYRPICDSAQELQLWNKIALEEERVSLGCLSGAGSRSLTPPLPSSSPGLPPPYHHITLFNILFLLFFLFFSYSSPFFVLT